MALRSVGHPVAASPSGGAYHIYLRNVETGVRAVKLLEGQYNKAFTLVIDNGAEVVAKIPNPNAGPAHYTTASEAATMDWVRPVRLSTKALSERSVAAKYREDSSACGARVELEHDIGGWVRVYHHEKAEGVPLSDVRYKLKAEEKNSLIQQIVDLQGRLSSHSVTMHGALFYREDAPTSPRECGDPGPAFTLGPSVDRSLWSDGRDELNVWKGPWQDISSYVTDLGVNEQQWVLKNAKPRMNYFRDSNEPEQPTEMLKLLEKYLKVAPYPTQYPEHLTNLTEVSLSHPDLHLGASFSPLVLHTRVPRMVRHVEPLAPGLVVPERPSHYEQLDTRARKDADVLYESARCQKYYEVLLAKTYPGLYKAILHNACFAVPFLEPSTVVCGCWKNRKVHKLRSYLMQIVADWDSLGIDLTSCPITFSQDEVDRHNEELENIDYIGSMMEASQGEGILPADGIVHPDDYEALHELNRQQKEKYLSLAADADELQIMDKTWPWQDWPERAAT